MFLKLTEENFQLLCQVAKALENLNTRGTELFLAAMDNFTDRSLNPLDLPAEYRPGGKGRFERQAHQTTDLSCGLSIVRTKMAEIVGQISKDNSGYTVTVMRAMNQTVTGPFLEWDDTAADVDRIRAAIPAGS